MTNTRSPTNRPLIPLHTHTHGYATSCEIRTNHQTEAAPPAHANMNCRQADGHARTHPHLRSYTPRLMKKESPPPSDLASCAKQKLLPALRTTQSRREIIAPPLERVALR